MNSITELLDLEDTDIIISDVHIEGTEIPEKDCATNCLVSTVPFGSSYSW